jgi:hypothetical protein
MFPPLLGLVFLLAGCGDSRPAETVRLVTYNAGTFNKYIADDYPLVAEMMREVGADAVCLNELDSCTTRTGGVFQLERIARAMGGWDYRFGRATHGYMPDYGPQPVFVAKGPGIREGVALGRGRVIDEAPTFAALLG